MNTEALKEPAATVAAVLAQRRRSWSWLAEATGLDYKKLLRRKSNPEEFRVGELGLIAAALDLDLDDLTQKIEGAVA